jgi:hypothetical protein
MKNLKLLILGIAASVMGMLSLGPAQASCYDCFVSQAGSDSNSCLETSPCLTMAHAVSVTSGGGYVHCLDGADYSGAVTITSSVTIDCEAFHSGFGPFLVNSTTGATVVIRGGICFDQGTPCIEFENGAMLVVERVQINNAPAGIYFEPKFSASLLVSGVLIIQNSTTTNPTGGIWIQPQSGAQASVSILDSRIEYNSYGIVGSGLSGGSVDGVIRNTVVSNNANYGIISESSGTAVALLVDGSASAANLVGLFSSGSGVNMLVRQSTITNNATGLEANGGGGLLSYGNNVINNNGTNGSFTGTVSQQ